MEGGKLLWLHQLELVDVINEVLKTGVQVCFGRQKHYVLEVSMVNVCIHTEQALEDHLDYVYEVTWKWHSQRAREHFLVIKLRLDPSH